MAKSGIIKLKDRKPLFIVPNEDPVEEKFPTLKSGIYKAEDHGGMFRTLIGFEEIKQKESLIKFKSGVVSEVIKNTEDFFSERTIEIYKKMGIAHKMATILYGPPGTGKTCTATLIMSEIVKKYNAVCLDFTNKKLSFIKQVVEALREIQDSPIVIFIDECEVSFDNDEKQWLTVLDGSDSFSDCIVLGCTNFFNNIPKRIRERRSRVKYTIEVKSLPDEVYREYIETKQVDMTKKEVSKMVYLCVEHGITIDELKHVLLDFCLTKGSMDKVFSDVMTYAKQEEWEDKD